MTVGARDYAETAASLRSKLQTPRRGQSERLVELQDDLPACAQTFMGGLENIVGAIKPHQNYPARIEAELRKPRWIENRARPVGGAAKDWSSRLCKD